MRGFRVVLWSSAAGCIIVLLLLNWGLTGCGGSKFPLTKTSNIPCGNTKIKVLSSNAVDKPAIYVCNNDKVSWKPDQGVTFVVHFDPSNCPFYPCTDITDANDKPVKMQPTELTVYKYWITITVNGVTNPTIDPHVVGGGGA